MPRNAPVHHRKSGQARLRIEGRDFYLGTFGTEEAEENYRRLLAEWLSTGVLPEPIGERREPTLFTAQNAVALEHHFVPGASAMLTFFDAAAASCFEVLDWSRAG